MSKDPAKPTHMCEQKRVIKFLDASTGLTLSEAHMCFIGLGLASNDSPIPHNWDEISKKIPDETHTSRSQEAAIA